MIIVPSMFTVPNGLNVVPSPLNWRRCKNEDSFGRAAETNTRTCEHNGKSAAIRESIVLPRERVPYQRDQALRSATVWQRPANAHRPLTTMVPLMVPLVSPVAKFTHRSTVKAPLA